MRIFGLLSVLLLLCGLTGCQGKDEPETRQKALSRGFAMMDRGQDAEAISYFAGLAAKDSHPHVRMAWASAYANRAGVRIEKIYSFAVVAAKTPDLPKLPYGLTFDRQTQDLLKLAHQFLARWQKIPALSEQGQSDVQSALDILGGSEEPSLRVYAAILRLILLKNVVDHGYGDFQNLQSQKICGKDLRPYFNWGVQILRQIELICQDLQASFPEQAESYRETENKVSAVLEEARKLQMPGENECFKLQF